MAEVNVFCSSGHALIMKIYDFKVKVEPLTDNACLSAFKSDPPPIECYDIKPSELWLQLPREEAYQSECVRQCFSGHEKHYCEKFEPGQFVYVATEDTLRRNAGTEPDHDDRWIVKILDFRVMGNETVAVVAWLYEASQLKGNARKVYKRHYECSDQERLLSNHGEWPSYARLLSGRLTVKVGIIDARSISDHAKVEEYWSSHVVKNDEDVLYWKFVYCAIGRELWSENGLVTGGYDPRSGVIPGQSSMRAPEAQMCAKVDANAM